jgi:hypothetical protein
MTSRRVVRPDLRHRSYAIGRKLRVDATVQLGPRRHTQNFTWPSDTLVFVVSDAKVGVPMFPKAGRAAAGIEVVLLPTATGGPSLD